MIKQNELRQAVLVIHGIGEQRPMQTLRGFVSSLLTSRSPRGAAEPAGPRFYSKPDRLTDTLELRRLSAWPPNVPVQTDFYELYWAHLLQGTAWSHLIAWLQVLMLRSPWRASGAIWGLWILSWAVVLGAIYQAYSNAEIFDSSLLIKYGIWGVLAYGVFRLMGVFGLNYLGDAARYLSPFPANIESRKNIRNAVIGVLTKLHEETPARDGRRYDRIVVVGHSLGSVIAYDALSHLWQARHSRLINPQPVGQPLLEEARCLGVDLMQNPPSDSEPEPDPRIEQYRRLQSGLWQEQLTVGVDWRISDLVTLGSPLTHCEFLLAQCPAQWAQMKLEREYPTSPPQFEDLRDEGRLVKQIMSFPSEHATLQILHHAALFACTRWTNLYFPADPVGGPVSGPDRFGVGIRDVALKPTRWWARWTPAAHVCYWGRKETFARRQLRLALNLAGEGGEISSAAAPNQIGRWPT